MPAAPSRPRRCYFVPMDLTTGVPYWLAAASPLLGALAYLGSRLLWKWSLGHYTGVNG